MKKIFFLILLMVSSHTYSLTEIGCKVWENSSLAFLVSTAAITISYPCITVALGCAPCRSQLIGDDRPQWAIMLEKAQKRNSQILNFIIKAKLGYVAGLSTLTALVIFISSHIACN